MALLKQNLFLVLLTIEAEEINEVLLKQGVVLQALPPTKLN